MYRALSEAVHIITAPSYVEADLIRLADAIAMHNKLFICLLRSLPPKPHIWTHSVRIMRLNGPHVHFWSMPGERKNKDIKNMADSTENHRNVPYTIGIRNQLSMSLSVANCKNDVGPLEIGTITNTNADSEVRRINKNIAGELNSRILSSLKFNSRSYQPGSVIIIGIDILPTFARILKRYEIKKNFIFTFNYLMT